MRGRDRWQDRFDGPGRHDDEVERSRLPAPGKVTSTSLIGNPDPPRSYRPAPGKRTLTMRLPLANRDEEQAAHSVPGRAAEGVAGPGAPLPHLQAIQAAFGRHDVSGIEAHVGGAAAAAAADIGAEAYATGSQVAFARSPDLHTAAHEAAHVVQQSSGVQLQHSVGRAGDEYERHADEVADRVVRGQSAEGLLDQMAGETGAASAAGGDGTAAAVQRKTDHDAMQEQLVGGGAGTASSPSCSAASARSTGASCRISGRSRTAIRSIRAAGWRARVAAASSPSGSSAISPTTSRGSSPRPPTSPSWLWPESAHVVHTPFVSRGGDRVGNPAPGENAATVDFVIEKAAYVGRWQLAENVGVYQATITARAGDHALWRGEIWAVDAGASMLHRTRPPLNASKLGPPRPPIATASATRSPTLTAKLQQSGVPVTDPAVARVLDSLDPSSEKWLEQLLDLERLGRVKGVSDWFDFAKQNPSPERIGKMLLEIREARRAVDEHPGTVIDIGADKNAPLKPGSATEKDKSFDLEASRGGIVSWSIEVKSTSTLVMRAKDINGPLEEAIDKVRQRAAHGQPIPGQREVRIDLSFFKGSEQLGGYARLQHDGVGGKRLTDDRGNPLPGRRSVTNVLDELTQHLNGKPATNYIDRVTIVNSGGVVARYERQGEIWARTK